MTDLIEVMLYRPGCTFIIEECSYQTGDVFKVSPEVYVQYEHMLIPHEGWCLVEWSPPEDFILPPFAFLGLLDQIQDSWLVMPKSLYHKLSRFFELVEEDWCPDPQDLDSSDPDEPVETSTIVGVQSWREHWMLRGLSVSVLTEFLKFFLELL